MKLPSKIGFVLLLFLSFSCSKNKERPTTSFYHWKSYYEISTEEIRYLNNLNVEKLYIRYFDIDFVNGKTEPLGKLVAKNDFKYPHAIIPTVFITNRTFKNVNEKSIDDLIDKTIQLIENTHRKISDHEIEKVQFDCDWSGSTRAIYFLFLQKIKEKSTWDISVTIRLHQVKYKQKTGVPPSDDFVLMCYNTGEVKDILETNSILDPKVVMQYTQGMSDYPHRLDVALPLFSWGVLFRENKLIKLIRNINANNFINNEKYKIDGNRIVVLESTYLNGYYLYEGDELRLEDSDIKNLELTSKILRKHLTPQEIIYYHLDSNIIKKVEYETLENINNIFVDR